MKQEGDFSVGQLKTILEHLINAIPGGIAFYRLEDKRFVPVYYSDGVMALSGHTKEELLELAGKNALNTIYEKDRERVSKAAEEAVKSGEVLEISYRMRHKDGSLLWLHVNGRRLGPLTGNPLFYAVIMGMSMETRLFQNIVNETADGVYVIDEKSYELLYASESKTIFMKDGCAGSIGKKCYEALQGKDHPCEFCTLKNHGEDEPEHEMEIAGSGRYYVTHFRKTDWNGIPAYVKYVRDATDMKVARLEKERIEGYFETVVENMPGGVAVIQYGKDGKMRPEYLSEGFASMTGMTLAEAWELYRDDATAGVHPEERAYTKWRLDKYVSEGQKHLEFIYRLKKGTDDYVWVKNSLSRIHDNGEECRICAVYQDITKQREEQENLQIQYNELIMQHYRTPDPSALIRGHCNITQGRIIEIIDYTGSDLIKTFGTDRERFFIGLSGFIQDEGERRAFQEIFLNEPALKAFEANEVEKQLVCFVKFPKEETGRYARFNMNMVAAPDSGAVTGILNVTDVTGQAISDRILKQFSAAGYDFVADVDLVHDNYEILSCNQKISHIPPPHGSYSDWTARMEKYRVVPRDRDQYSGSLNPEAMKKRLEKERSYTFSFSIADDNGDIRIKNMTVSAVDLRLGRVCLSRADITESIREQQGMLNMLAYTFELAGFIDIGSGRFTMYTRRTVLENLPPHIVENYETSIGEFVKYYGNAEMRDEIETMFSLDTILTRLKERPSGYDFVFSFGKDEEFLYKQINVLWGDQNCRTVCLVRQDVTDMLASERKAKRDLEEALALAKKANQAKNEFLSSMSHDIRTPMNAIIGMTMLAETHIGDQARVEDCLQKIAVSSKHLLSLVNDVLDMSKIERSQMTLNRDVIILPELLEQIATMLKPQARASQLNFEIRQEKIVHEYFYGDLLRLNQIFINILGNAIKFTPQDGSVELYVEETALSDRDGYAGFRFVIRDTGIGMPEEFLEHIFEPFARSDGSAYIEGTGLGLSITKSLVEMMGGKIFVESQINKGTVFIVELEFEIAQANMAVRKKEKKPEKEFVHDQIFSGRRILIVEDNEINAEIACGLIEMFGAEYDVKADGFQAVAAFKNSPPGTYDVILMDVRMPKMNGYEATRQIRKMEREDAAKIPIIAMTANAYSEDVQEALNAGMTAHVAKPIDIKLLRETLEYFLED